MTTSCSVSKHGLTADHAYTIIGAVAFEYKGVQQKLLKMRNPWATENYNGPWNDNDKRWTPELRQQVGSVKANDGIFFMPILVLKEAFNDYQVAHYRNWKKFTTFASGQAD